MSIDEHNTICVYTDETKNDTNTFRIIAILYGKENSLFLLGNRLEDIIWPSGRGAGGTGLHANKLNDSNWHSGGAIAEKVLAELVQAVRSEDCDIEILIISEQKHKDNLQ